MCIIAAKPQGLTLSEETINTCWEANSDGAGFMYAERGKLIVEKGFMSLDSFKRAYNKVGDKPAVLHFRIKTHGAIDAENTHPFQINDNLAFAHNGIIGNIATPNKDKSDTWHFNETLLKPMASNDLEFLRKSWNVQLISGFIGYSKLAFMEASGRITLINADKGTWDDGIWYSNTSYKPKNIYPISKYKTSKRNSIYSEGDWVEVRYVRQKAHQSTIAKGDVGLVDKTFPGGYISVVFHEWIGNVAREVTLVIHEDDVAYKWVE